MTDPRPDLVLVMTDQQRHDQIGYASGGRIRTPTLDRLAAGGITFPNAYSASTTCVPARTSLMTGLFDHRVPSLDRYTIEPGTFTLPHALAAAGYQTALIGKMHFNPIREDHGFEHMRTCEHLNGYARPPSELPELDHYHDHLHELGLADWRFELPGGLDAPVMPYPYPIETHPTSWVRDETLSFLAGRDPNRPLFLVVSFPHPHPAVNPPEPYASLYDPAGCAIDPDGARANDGLPPQYRRATAQADHAGRRIDPAHLAAHQLELARTWGLVTQIDDALAPVVDQLDLSRTLLQFTADHGDYGGRRGLVRKIPWIPFDDLAKVPCFLAGGPVAGAGRVDDIPMQAFDFAVTCLDAAGVDVDLGLFDGRSQLAQLADPGGTGDPERIVLSALSMGWPMARRRAHKYIRELGWREEVLFEVEYDPDETVNMAMFDTDRTYRDTFAAEVDRVLAAPVPDLPRFDRR